MLKKFLLLAACAIALACAPVQAQDFPTKPIKIIVGTTPGGPSDLFSRAIATGLEKRLGQPVVVENKPGASWLIATAALAQAPADGYTLLFTYSTPLSVLPFMYKKPLPYTVSDFAGVALIGEQTAGLIVKGDSQYKTLKDFVAAAKAQNENITVASAGAGQLYSLATEMFSRQVGIRVRDVPFLGVAPINQALLAGTVDSTYMELGSTRPYIESGKFRLLAVAGDDRLKAFPDVPTFAEAGFPQHKIPRVWMGLIAPAKIPAGVKAKLNQAINQELQGEALQKLFELFSTKPLSGTPDQLDRMIKEDVELWGGVAQRLGVKLD